MSALVIRPFRPIDGVGISELFRRVYGDHYVSPDVYVPQMICQHNLLQHWHSVVALVGEHIVGHAALCRQAIRREDGELALIAVDPTVQGGQIATRLGAATTGPLSGSRTCEAVDQASHQPLLQPAVGTTAGFP